MYYYVGMLGLYSLRQLSEHCRLTYSGHVLEAYFCRSSLYQLVGNAAVILNRVYGRRRYAERGLRSHAGLERPLDARYDVAHVVKSAEYAGDVDSLGVLHLIHKAAHVVGHGVHPERVESAVEHVGLYAHLVERLAKRPYCVVRILACQQVHLLEGSAVGLNAGETPHVDDGRSHTLKLVLTRLELA